MYIIIRVVVFIFVLSFQFCVVFKKYKNWVHVPRYYLLVIHILICDQQFCFSKKQTKTKINDAL